MTCKVCNSQAIALFQHGLCKKCFDAGLSVAEQPKPVKKIGRPVGAVPFDKKAYDRQYFLNNIERLRQYNTLQHRKKRILLAQGCANAA